MNELNSLWHQYEFILRCSPSLEDKLWPVSKEQAFENSSSLISRLNYVRCYGHTSLAYSWSSSIDWILHDQSSCDSPLRIKKLILNRNQDTFYWQDLPATQTEFLQVSDWLWNVAPVTTATETDAIVRVDAGRKKCKELRAGQRENEMDGGEALIHITHLPQVWNFKGSG